MRRYVDILCTLLLMQTVKKKTENRKQIYGTSQKDQIVNLFESFKRKNTRAALNVRKPEGMENFWFSISSEILASARKI